MNKIKGIREKYCEFFGEKVKYKNNYYRIRDGVWYVLGGDNLKYISRVNDGGIICKLNGVLNGGTELIGEA